MESAIIGESRDILRALYSAVRSVIFRSLEFYKMSELNLGGRPKTSGVWDCFKYRFETDLELVYRVNPFWCKNCMQEKYCQTR